MHQTHRNPKFRTQKGCLPSNCHIKLKQEEEHQLKPFRTRTRQRQTEIYTIPLGI